MANCKFDKEIARMKRIEGQARGIARMMEEDRYCIDILQQMTAMEAALRAAKGKVLAIHSGHCIEEAVQSGDAAAQREKFGELVDLFGKMSR
ncbi:metal-sensitive transcriptional regulator [Parasphingopyxis algicola]|uniref:metal-sensitive transcriptional regulator n=1 Tax=Parasphingopyxis algicola TaxID=2026624 RepID=UPI0015A32574|nr:metal-sensitive transcriptional regulator [Parasphingopyxis algicola]QLC26526.1 metal-sensitive transcriptional regulator [Parasphingopyxis algicola]